MSIKNLQLSIKTSLRIINKAIKQIPEDRRPIIVSRMTNVLKKYQNTQQKQQLLSKFKKQLQFNLNFIKLSHPNLDFTVDKVQQVYDKKQQNGKAQNNVLGEQKDKKQVQHQVKLVNQSGLQIQRLNQQDTFDQQQQRQKITRQQVEFSNWFEGNVDPELLKRHKQLLQRQHFKGDFWKGKQKPKLYAQQYLKEVIAEKMQQVQRGQAQMPEKNQEIPDFTPKNVQQSQAVWQKVKR